MFGFQKFYIWKLETSKYLMNEKLEKELYIKK